MVRDHGWLSRDPRLVELVRLFIRYAAECMYIYVARFKANAVFRRLVHTKFIRCMR